MKNGIKITDPIADGPVIQDASFKAIQNGAFILDKKYLQKLQEKNSDCKGAFCGYGVAVKDFKNPIIDFDRNNTYIQSEGINQDFGVYDSPDDLLKAHHQEMSAIKAFLYKHFGRHLMNRNVKKIRNC